MKTSLKLWALALALALFTHYTKADELPKVDWNDRNPAPLTPEPAGGEATKTPEAPKKASSWWTDFSVSPYGAFKHADLSGQAIYGAGLDLGYQINRTVSLHVGNTVFDYNGCNGDGWLDGPAIDETEVLFRADLIRGGGQGKDRFVAFLLGSGTRDWTADDWAFGVGGGAEIKLSKNFGLGADYRLRAYFDQPKDGIARAFLSAHF